MIFVTGAIGQSGAPGGVSNARNGAAIKALARDPEGAGLPTGVEVVRGDLSHPERLAQYLSGADAVSLVWPFLNSEGAAELADTLPSQAQRIVYLLAEAAGRRPESFWALVERVIERSAAEWTLLRPTGFAANTLMWADQIRQGDFVRRVYGQAARSLIDERHIAEVAVRVLTEDGHAGNRYVLTEPATSREPSRVGSASSVEEGLWFCLVR